MRSALCKALNLSEEEMPFAGELLQVHEDERDWEGAAERLLRSFGLSLLVPDERYAAVAEWVDTNSPEGPSGLFPYTSEFSRLNCPVCTAILWRASWRLSPTLPFYDWLERELAHRFDVGLLRHSRAISPRNPGHDPCRPNQGSRVNGTKKTTAIGWMIVAVTCWAGATRPRSPRLEDRALQLERNAGGRGGRVAALQKEQGELRARLETLTKLAETDDFRELDWRPLAAELERLKDEKRQLELASDVLKALTAAPE